MKILLIGASGMIGSRILAEAAARGHAVHAASRNPNKIALPEGAEAVALDVTDGAAVAQAAEGVDVIVTTVSPRSTGDAVSEMAAIGAGAASRLGNQSSGALSCETAPPPACSAAG